MLLILFFCDLSTNVIPSVSLRCMLHHPWLVALSNIYCYIKLRKFEIKESFIYLCTVNANSPFDKSNLKTLPLLVRICIGPIPTYIIMKHTVDCSEAVRQEKFTARWTLATIPLCNPLKSPVGAHVKTKDVTVNLLLLLPSSI
jgi:hypothetical protein